MQVPSRLLTVRLSFLLALVALLASCARNPVTGKRELTLLSEEQEIAMGREADPQIVATYGLYEDPAVSAYVDGMGKRLAALSHRPELPWTFRVLDSPVVNAFALPGGFIYITRGILAYMNDEAQLAMVLGHEIGHVTARHSVQQYSRAQLAGLGLGVGSILLPDLARYGELAQSAMGLLFLKYGRDHERQSDELGVSYSTAGGYDPRAGSRFFEVLDRMQEESGQMLPAWLSTHPDPEERVARTSELAGQAVQEHPEATAVREVEHKRAIDGIVFGENPRHGFADGGWFKHPDLAFRLAFPSGWPVQNTASVVLAAEPENRAALQMTLEPSEGLDPSAFAARVVEGARARVVEGRRTSIHGYDAFVGILAVPAEGTADGGAGGEVPVMAAFIQRERGGPIYQILGFTAEGAFGRFRPDFQASVESFQALTDPADLAVQPNRIDVEAIDAGLTLSQAVARAPDVPVPAGAIALLNNRDPETALSPGFLLKLVRGSYRRE